MNSKSTESAPKPAAKTPKKKPAAKPKPRATKSKVMPEDVFNAQLIAAGLVEGEDYVRQLKFHPTRRWRADFGFPNIKVIIEIEGGLFGLPIRCHNCKSVVKIRMNNGRMMMARQSGRHNTAVGFESDCIKYAEAELLGWRVFRFSSGQVKNGLALEYLNKIFQAQPGIEGIKS